MISCPYCATGVLPDQPKEDIDKDMRLIDAGPDMLKFIERVRDFARENGDDALYAEADALIERVVPETEAA